MNPEDVEGALREAAGTPTIHFGVTVMGIDPGLANIGLFAVRHLTIGVQALACKFVATKKSDKKRRMRQADDDVRRLDEVEQAVQAALDEWKPEIVAMEHAPNVRNSTVSKQIGMAFGAMHALARQAKLPVLVYDPQEIKLAICQSRSASKAQVTRGVKGRFPGFKGWPTGPTVEHVADAGAVAILAGTDALVQLLLRERGPKP